MYVKELGWGAPGGKEVEGAGHWGSNGAVRLGIDFRWHVRIQQAVHGVDRCLVFVGSRRGEVPVYIIESLLAAAAVPTAVETCWSIRPDRVRCPLREYNCCVEAVCVACGFSCRLFGIHTWRSRDCRLRLSGPHRRSDKAKVH